MTGSVSGFLTSCVNVVESTGSSVAFTPRFVFHWFWNHSSLVLFLALEEYVSLRLARAAVLRGDRVDVKLVIPVGGERDGALVDHDRGPLRELGRVAVVRIARVD